MKEKNTNIRVCDLNLTFNTKAEAFEVAETVHSILRGDSDYIESRIILNHDGDKVRMILDGDLSQKAYNQFLAILFTVIRD